MIWAAVLQAAPDDAMHMGWGDIVKVALTLALFLAPAHWALVEVRMRKVFASRDDLTALANKVEGVVNLVAQRSGALDDMRDRVHGLEQHRAYEKLRVAEALGDAVRAPFERITTRLDGIVDMQASHAVLLGALEERCKGMGRSIDELRTQRVRAGGDGG